MFNLNDPRWGRDDDNNNRPEARPEDVGRQDAPPRPSQRPKGANQGPPDLDELWRDFNRKL